jgi:hypothetical protein
MLGAIVDGNKSPEVMAELAQGTLRQKIALMKIFASLHLAN